MRDKTCSIAKQTIVPIRITGANRNMLKAYEKKMMDEVGVKDPCAIPNSSIINRAISDGYNSEVNMDLRRIRLL